MTPEEAREAITQGLTVKLPRPGFPNKPYIGIINKELRNENFWFTGASGDESISIRTRAANLSVNSIKGGDDNEREK